MAELTVKQWAEQQGISRQAAHKRIKSGKVQLNANGKIDVDQAAKQWESNKDSRQQQRGAPKIEVPPPRPAKKAPDEEDPRSLAAAQKAREWIRVGKEDMLLRKMRGELLPKDEVEQSWSSMVSAARSRLLLVPDKIAAKVAAVSNVLEVRAIIDAEIKEALSALAESN